MHDPSSEESKKLYDQWWDSSQLAIDCDKDVFGSLFKPLLHIIEGRDARHQAEQSQSLTNLLVVGPQKLVAYRFYYLNFVSKIFLPRRFFVLDLIIVAISVDPLGLFLLLEVASQDLKLGQVRLLEM